MVSASKEKRLAKKAAEGKEKKTVASRSKAGSKAGSNVASAAASVDGDETPPLVDEVGDEDDAPATSANKMDEVKRLAEQMDKHGLSDRVTTGVLSSTPQSKDVKITSVSLVFHGRVLINDATLELSYGRRYGLLGENGCGKSTMLKAIDKREYPIPEHIDIYLLNEGAPLTDLGALEWVVKEAENEMERLDKLAEKLLEEEGPESQVLMDLYDVSLPSASDASRPSYHTDLFATTAPGKDGPLDFCDPSVPHPHRSWVQQEDDQQEDQGHVWWLEDARGAGQGAIREAFAPASR